MTQNITPFSWKPIIYFYCLYILIILIGGILGVHTSSFGGAFLLIFLYLFYIRYLILLKFDYVIFCILICLLAPIVPMVFFDKYMFHMTYQLITKYYGLYLIMLLSLSLPLTPILEERKKSLLFIIIVLFQFSGWIWTFTNGGGLDKIKGFLPNPNGFALTSMMLFFLINEDKKKKWLSVSSHLIAVVFIYVSSTSGAILGYFSGFAYQHMFSTRSKYRVTKILLSTLIITTIVFTMILIPKGIIKPRDRLIEKIKIVNQYSDRIVKNKKIDFYSIINRNGGEDLTSGLWRIYQWKKILVFFINSPFDKILFGYGIGSTAVLFNLKSHNDYLRILFETGLIGFIAGMIAWSSIFFRMDHKYRWVVVMIAVFCLTENNFDHFPAMSLLIFFMVSSKKEKWKVDDIK